MPVHLLIFCSCIVHVENVAQDFVAVEAEAEGAEGQEELYPELEAVEPVEEPAPEANFPNSFSQPGKPRFINPVSYISLSFIQFSTYAYAFKFIGIVWYLDACGRFDISLPWYFPDN